jgi:hypothetical protein
MVDLNTADQRANDFAAGEPIGRLDALFHLSGEVLQTADQQPQFVLEHLRIRELTHLLVERRDALALADDA